VTSRIDAPTPQDDVRETVTAPQFAAESDEVDYGEIEQLFTRLAESCDERERRRWRCRIITDCVPLADHIAYRFVGRGEPGDDLIQVARLGLVKAIDRYDPRKGRFLSFAVPTITGEVRRHFRDNTWGMRVPRKVKDTQQLVRKVIDPLSQRLARSPTASELAAELDVDCDDVSESLGAGYAYRPLSLEATTPGGGDQTIGARHGAEDQRYGIVEDTIALEHVVKELSQREQEIVRMRYYQCLTQTEIGQRLGLSQVHVSRLLAKTLDRLRRRLSVDVPTPIAALFMTVICI
jgi:RNA polymerase sigma-B factor